MYSCLPLNQWINRKVSKESLRWMLKPVAFTLIYLLVSFTIVPLVAKPFGRVPLPVSSEHVRPLNWMTCLFNRHYVKPELLAVTENVADRMQEEHPGTIVAYLDANFPFFNGFPLVPHLSHNDGEKLDLAFFYTDSETGEQLNNRAPSFIGYGVHESPRPGEENTPDVCAGHGYWQYGLLERFIPQGDKEDFKLDEERTKALVMLFARNNAIGKVFIEPHLKSRLGLNHERVRFHGCHAVRHDDHIHVQLK